MEDLKIENQNHNQQLEVKKSTTEAHFYKQKTMEKEGEDLKKEVCELRLTFGFLVDFHVNYTIKKEQYLPCLPLALIPMVTECASEWIQMGICHGKKLMYTYLMQGPYDDHLKCHSEER